jgi:hypothetical protein
MEKGTNHSQISIRYKLTSIVSVTRKGWNITVCDKIYRLSNGNANNYLSEWRHYNAVVMPASILFCTKCKKLMSMLVNVLQIMRFMLN